MDNLISELGGSASTLSRRAVHRVRTNILPRVERELRDNIVPTLERKGKELKERWQTEEHATTAQRGVGVGVKRRRRRPRPPSNTDIVYMTERFLVSSKPASDCSNISGPTFFDTGRDISAREAREAAEKADKRQQQRPRQHDRAFRLREKMISRSMHGGTNDAILENSENQEREQEPSTSSIPEEEGHDPPTIDGDSSSSRQLVGNKEEAAKFSENPQDGGAEPSSAATTTIATTVPSSPGHAGTAVGEEGDVIIHNQEEDTQLSPATKQQSLSPVASTTATINRPLDAETTFRASFHSNATDLIENYKEVTDHSSTTHEAKTPLTKNAPARAILDYDVGEQSTGEGPPSIPSISHMPVPPPSPNMIGNTSKSGYGYGSGSDNGDDASVETFASCRMDDNGTFDATPEPQQESRSEPAVKPPQHSSISSPPPTAASIINSPGSMVTHLDNVHGRDNYLAVSLAKEKPDDRTMLLFRRQIVPMGLGGTNGNHSSSSKWSPCCVERSETPSIQHVLKICYALHAFLHLDPNNVVLTYCDNGKTRTAIVAACYLRFSNMVEKTEDGFRFFLSTLRKQRKLLLEREKERRKAMGPLWAAAMDAMMEGYYDDEDCDWETTNGGIPVREEKKKSDAIVENIIQQIPPSLKLFFEQFDRVLQLGGFLNRKPLLLRAIMLQGVPVEDQPCIDIWDSSQQHVYSSHPLVSTSTPRNNKKQISQWVDEEGFYRINAVLDGEFLVLCRFGGNPAQLSKERNIHDPSRILFRYTNTTGFMSGGCPYELPSKKVDLMRLYADHLDDEEFLLTLLFEADWEHIEDDEYNVDTSVSLALRNRLGSGSEACGQRIWRSHEEEARDEGWRVIFENHCARPSAADMDSFRCVHRHPSTQGRPDLNHCPDHLIALSLQLTNFDFQRTAALLLNSPVFSWWLEDEDPESSLSGAASTNIMKGIDSEKRDHHSLGIESDLNLGDGSKRSFQEIENEATQSILDILDSVDVSSNLDPTDQNYLDQWRLDLPRDSLSSKGARDQDRATSIDGQHLSSDRQKSLSTLCLKETGYLIPSVIYPHRGDIVRSFHIHGSASSPERRNDTNSALPSLGKRKPSVTKPRIPYFSNDKPKLLPLPSDHIRIAKRLFDSTQQEHRVPVYDSQLEAAKEIHSQLRHTGVTLDMLLELQQSSKQWTGFPEYHEKLNRTPEPDPGVEETPNVVEKREASINREVKGKKEKEWQDAQKAEAEEKRKGRKQEKAKEVLDEMEGEKEVPLKDNPEYAKYFKMLKLGMHREQVLHAFQRDGKDPKILDLDLNKSLESQLPSTGGEEKEDVPLKGDPEYAKYFKMLKLGMQRAQVLHALQRGGKDPKILDLDPNKSLESQIPGANTNEEGELPLEDDPEYEKYFKMLKLGMSKEQVVHALKRDDKNPKILDLDPKKSLNSQVETPAESGDGIPLKDDPEYSKYFKMMKMGMHKEQVLHALKRDGKDPKVLDLDPNKSLKSQEQNDDCLLLKDDPEYGKYFRMEKVGLPRDAVKNALVRDGKDPSIIDLDPNKSLKSQISGKIEQKDTGIPMKDDPDYDKYFKMEKMGMPKDVVRNALVRDGRNPAIADFDPKMSVDFQLKKLNSSSEKPVVKKKKKKKVRRKKIYWNTIDPSKLKKDSIWNIVSDRVEMGNLDYDQKEFEELFTESAEANVKQKKKAPAKKEAKKAVQAIDPKRSMNGGIVLSRIKTDRAKIAEFVGKMDHTKFDATQLKNLKEYLATADERQALDAYMSKGSNSEEKKEELFKDLSETEKYMVTLMQVSDAEAKLHTMEFRDGFKNRFADLTLSLRTLNSACDELRSSEKFRKLMAMILTVVNQINTGGEGILAMGFTLAALLKLNEAKAFDKKTSVLHYVVKLVKKNDESLLYFENDLGHVIPAESVLLDAIIGDMKVLQNEVTEITKIVTKDADSVEKSGDAPKLTLAELVEQKSIVQHIEEASQQLNTNSHLTGRTPMERFSMNAKVACDQAHESINSVQAKYGLILGYFGEDENMPSGDFFGTLRRFMTEWKKATKQVENIERKKAKEKKREERRAAKAKKSKRLKSSSRRKRDGEKAATNPLPPPGGIASLAAEAALKISQQQETGEVRSKPPLGGIAALTAQAALKKSKEQEKGNEDSRPEPPLGGIAALAAQAALKKSKEQEKGKEDSRPEPPIGGIAALAAQAAMKMSKEQERGKEYSRSEPPLGVIAALAAEAALKKSKERQTEDSRPEQSVGGIAALAAQAALKKSKEQEKGNEDSRPEPPLGGIAALASQAALKKSKEQEKGKEDSRPKPPLGGIATLAAEDALKKLKEQEKEDSHPEAPVGGIAALTAQTALKNSYQAKEYPSVGGTAALAAQAALKNSEAFKTEEGRPEQSVGGIAELTAEAALEKSEKQDIKAGTSQQTPGGGIAATSAQATNKISEKQASKREESPSKPSVGGSTAVVIKAACETSEKQEEEESHSEPPASSMSSLDVQVVSPQYETPEKSPIDALSSIAAQVGTEKTPNRSPQHETTEKSPTGGLSSLTAQVALERTPKRPSQDESDGLSSLAAQIVSENTPIQSPQYKTPKSSPADKVSSPAAQVASEITPNRSPQYSTPKSSPADEMSSFATQVNSENATKGRPQDKPTCSRSSLALAIEKGEQQAANKSKGPSLGSFFERQTRKEEQSEILRQNKDESSKLNSPSNQNKSPKHSPTDLMSSLSLAIEKAKQQDASSIKGPSLGSFFERQTRKEERSEILRQNNDESSVALMAENLQKEPMLGNAWNQGGGISDYIGWANQAIKASDTESVRDFENARDMVYDDQSTIATNMDDSTYATNFDDGTIATNMDDSTHASNYDDGTIATNYDDDASIATEMAPMNDLGYSGGGEELFNSEQYSNYAGDANDPYSYTMAPDGTQNPYGDALINMPLEFNQDQGLHNGLSFGGDDGFDSPGKYGTDGTMHGGDGYGVGLSGFGQDVGLGTFGMTSTPTLGRVSSNNFSNTGLPGPPLGGANATWGNSPPKNQVSQLDEDRSRPSDDAPKEDGVVFRGWGEAPKTPEQPKKKNWFWN